MGDGFYQYFLHKTEGFVFSDSGSHRERVMRLVTQVRKMAITYFHKTPTGFEKEFNQDDWIQHAMIKMYECVESYDRKRPFDNYARFIIKRRLEDQRRKLYRRNPNIETSDETGNTSKVFRPLSDSIQRKAKANEIDEPEQHYLMKEARQVLLLCVQKMGETGQMLFAKHEMEAVSFKKLFKLVPDYTKSFASFKRWYKADIFDRVKECVKSQLVD